MLSLVSSFQQSSPSLLAVFGCLFLHSELFWGQIPTKSSSVSFYQVVKTLLRNSYYFKSGDHTRSIFLWIFQVWFAECQPFFEEGGGGIFNSRGKHKFTGSSSAQDVRCKKITHLEFIHHDKILRLFRLFGELATKRDNLKRAVSLAFRNNRVRKR